MSPVIDLINKADLLFSPTLYIFIASAQLQRFIELLKQSGVSLEGKYAAQITTSKRFYDVTAHSYIEENCHDLKLKYIAGLSADMDDLLSVNGQKDAREFFEYVLWCAENDYYVKSPSVSCSYTPAPGTVPDDPSEPKTGDVVIVTDCEENDPAQNKIARFRAVLPRKTRVVNIREYPFKGGCLGCFNCGVGQVVYKDGTTTLRNDSVGRGNVKTFTIKTT